MDNRLAKIAGAARVAVTLVAALAGTGCERFTASRVEPASIESSSSPRRVVALGSLEPAGGIVSISSVPGEQLLRLGPDIVEGARAAAGAELATMGSYGLRQTQLAAAEEKLAAAQQQRDQQRAAARAQLEQAQAARAQAEAKLQETAMQEQQLQNLAEAAAIARDDLAQLERLNESDPELVSDQQLRRRRNASERAAKDYEAAAATFPHALEAARKSVEAAEANVRLAQSNVEFADKVDQTVAIELERRAAEQSLEQSVLRAPDVEGGSREFTVLRIHMQPGELVTQLPVMEIGDLSSMVCVAEVYEADVKDLAEGQRAIIRSPAFSGAYADRAGAEGGGIQATVRRVGAMIGSPGLTNRNPLAPSDRSVVDVVVQIDSADQRATAEAARHIGLQVTVEFVPSEGAEKQ
ncbi:MAG: hypothetical protein IT424_01430 [Pirellulales bacterium]|nr:hypothetical protein [Pirellulales bacterium]